MHFHVFFPQDLVHRSGKLLGYKMGDAFVVIQTTIDGARSDSGLEVVGTLNCDYSENLGPIGLWFSNEVTVKSSIANSTWTVVTFAPPNARNLEYFTLEPILLQSTGEEMLSKSQFGVDFAGTPQATVCVAQEEVLAKINTCQSVRRTLRRGDSDLKLLPTVKLALLYMLHAIASWVILVAVILLRILNFEARGVSLVTLSCVARQFDLRLRQLSYLPFQVMCYFDNLKISLLQRLDLPTFNHQSNVLNSNYINFYNLLWLLVNDVLLGMTVQKVLMTYKDRLISFAQYVVLAAVFTRLEELVRWIGSDHPAGFKLNNELGHFLEDMLLWTLHTWRFVILAAFAAITNGGPLLGVASVCFSCACKLGFSFVVALAVDLIHLITLHITLFNLATTKIYSRQLEMLKSLVQLFRGKKYNVLRNRIDSLDADHFHIDKLLLGTFAFVMLIYLLPTILAFYFLFFASRLAVLTTSKIGDKAIVAMNLFPIFVLLLKLKNSRRLQGGVTFQWKSDSSNATWLHMANKALTMDEILGNFLRVWRQQGQPIRLALNFLEGKVIELKNTRKMKFCYLMLPAQFDRLAVVWGSSWRQSDEKPLETKT